MPARTDGPSVSCVDPWRQDHRPDAGAGADAVLAVCLPRDASGVGRILAADAAAGLAQQIVSFVQAVRRMELQKKPGIAETLDWTAALLRLGISAIDIDGTERIMETLSALIKTRDDRAAFPRAAVARLAAAC